jgi:hypothetical protein
MYNHNFFIKVNNYYYYLFFCVLRAINFVKLKFFINNFVNYIVVTCNIFIHKIVILNSILLL